MRSAMTRVVGLCAVMILLVAPSLLPASGSAPPTAKEFDAARKNLKKIALAFHNVSESNDNILPFDFVSKDGKPLLSWRVGILAYIDEDALYKQFNLDEAWDSAHNKTLIAKMPKVY